jgi:hypothetical protein
VKKPATWEALAALTYSTRRATSVETRNVRNLCVTCGHPAHIGVVACWLCPCDDGRSYYDYLDELDRAELPDLPP